MAVKLSKLPDPPKEYTVEFPRLDGGLNLLELPYRLENNESPEMQNLWWQDGVLCCRDGQTRLTGDGSAGTGHSAYEGLFWGCGFFHIGDKLCCAPLTDPDMGEGALELELLLDGVPEQAGTWFRYGDKLYYKCPGAYVEIGYETADSEDWEFTARSVRPYAPVILINTEPTQCAGDTYQPENRLSPQKTVWYTAALAGELDLDHYETGAELLEAINNAEGVKEYHLPVQDVDSVDKVVVDGVELAQGTGYTVDLQSGVVTFVTPPPFHYPVQANTVEITYSKANPEAYSSVMDCRYAAVYGGDRNVCVVLAGCPAQPNAYFWCGNHSVMDPGYFPVEQYNLAGDADEAITGFGKQQSMLVIFKEHSVGRASFEATEMQSGRVLLSMPYTAINARIGCDLPGTIQLIENNLVFANRAQGIHIVLDTSPAYENNIQCVSRKVNGTPGGGGLLKLLAGTGRAASFDDDTRYWLAAGGQVYAWDYSISTYTDPSWFYFTDIPGVAFLRGEQGMSCHMDALGRVSVLRRNFSDYGQAIEKVYRFAVQHMGTFDRLKDVTRCVFSVRGDTDTEIGVEYETDYERRADLTPIRSYSWSLVPCNLAYCFLGVRRFATVAVRKPGCRHVRHFVMKLTNRVNGMDMAVISATVHYRYQRRDR